MPLPKNIQDVIRKKQELMLRQEQLLGRRISGYQNQILTQTLERLYSELDVVGGVIKDTAKNYRVMGSINQVLKEVENDYSSKIATTIGNTNKKIEALNNNYFKLILTPREITKFQKVTEMASRKMQQRIGVVQNRLVKGGFLDGVLNTTELATQASDLVVKSVTAQVPMREMTGQLRELIQGTGEWGYMERRFDNLAHDVYMQYDAAYSNNVGNQFELNYFIYQGGLVEESRDFCREHNNRVYHRKDAKKWDAWTPAKARFITEFKQKDPYKVPSYISYAGYQPLIDRGGYNCRHSINWISDELAQEMGYDGEAKKP